MRTCLPYKSVVFDLDGTLLDTWPSLFAAVEDAYPNAAMTLDRTQLMRALSVGIDAMFMDAAVQCGVVADAVPAALVELRRHYETNWLEKAQPYPGASVLLETLTQDGQRLGICTNRDSGTTRSLLQRLGWAECFSAVLCVDQVVWPKPDPAHLFAVINALGATPESCLYVGDSALDARCAAAARVDFAAHAAGYHSHLKDLQPHLFAFDNHQALQVWLLADTAQLEEISHG